MATLLIQKHCIYFFFFFFFFFFFLFLFSFIPEVLWRSSILRREEKGESPLTRKEIQIGKEYYYKFLSK